MWPSRAATRVMMRAAVGPPSSRIAGRWNKAMPLSTASKKAAAAAAGNRVPWQEDMGSPPAAAAAAAAAASGCTVPRQGCPERRSPASRSLSVEGFPSVRGFLRERRAASAYVGDGAFLAGPTAKTRALVDQLEALWALERERGGVLDVDTLTVAAITSHAPGYLDKENEVIVGLQTDAPLRRAVKPFGGSRVTKVACESHGYMLDPAIEKIFTEYAMTHNEAVFDCYTAEMRAARKNKLLTGLPDGYGRGRIVGDYRRVALYGVDALVEGKKADLNECASAVMTEEAIRHRFEIAQQIKALKQLKTMAASYAFDISGAATTAREAVQWTYFAYLATVKSNDGAATSLPRLDMFFDAYIEADLASGVLKSEAEAQELVDQFCLKLRMVDHLRTPEYQELFSGDPTWATLTLGGADAAGEALVCRTSFRLLRTLDNIGRHPEPNLTVLWSAHLPAAFKAFAARCSVETSSIQYENDDLMRPTYGDDYLISCCVSAMAAGEQTQFFGARCNLPKVLLYSLNGGVDETTLAQVGPRFDKDVCGPTGHLDYGKVRAHFDEALDWIARLYADTMNVIHWSHDRYFYEALPMALHDSDLETRFIAFGASGIATVADSLAAIKYGRVRPVRNAEGVTTAFVVDSDPEDLPRYGTDDNRADDLVKDVVATFHGKLAKQHTYRGAVPTLSLLTITSNVVYGKQTGPTPDGRVGGQVFAPGSNPAHGRDSQGALASLNSIAKVPYADCMDGISNTFSITPKTLGKAPEDQCANLVALLDGYFAQGGQHINVNVMDRALLLDAIDHPEKYPNLVVRISGYAVMFHKLTREQQTDIVTRTFHETM